MQRPAWVSRDNPCNSSTKYVQGQPALALPDPTQHKENIYIHPWLQYPEIARKALSHIIVSHKSIFCK